MSDLSFVTGDDQPSIAATLTQASGTAFDLSTATNVHFQMRQKIDRRLTLDAVATIIGAAAGTVRYDWAPGDLDTAGDYISRWQINWADGTSQSTEPENTITVDNR